MIKDKTIYFGYGDVAVGYSSLWGYVEFTNIKPPLTPGEVITEEKYKGLEIGLTIKLKEDYSWDIYNLVKTVNENNRIVKYKDYILDFSNFNENSVKVVLNAAYKTVDLMCLAC